MNSRQKDSRDLEVLCSVARAAGSTLDVREVALRAWTEIEGLIHPDICLIVSYDSDQNVFTIPFFVQSGTRYDLPDRIDSATGLAGYVLRTRRPVFIPDLLQAEAELAEMDIRRMRVGDLSREERAYVGVPMMARGHFQGVFSLQSYTPNAFHPDRLGLIQAIGNQIGIAMESAHLFRKSTEQLASLRTVLDSAPIGIIAFDENGIVRQVNRYHAETFGRGAMDDYVGRVCMTDKEVVGRDIASSCAELLAAGRPFELSSLPVRTHFTGHDAVVNATGVPLHRGEAVSGGVVLVEDATESRLLEKQLVRTERLDALSEMAIGLTRNLNNLMAVILGTAQLLQSRQELPSIVEDRARTIGQTVQRAAAIVRKLQSLTRSDPTGKSHSLVDPNSIVEEALGFSRHSGGEASSEVERAVRITRNLGEDLTVYGDSSEIREVVTSLIDNAFDAMPQGGTLAIETRRASVRFREGNEEAVAKASAGDLVDAKGMEGDGGFGQAPCPPPGIDRRGPGNGEWIEIVVTDTGVGMTDEIAERAFEPFFTTKTPKMERGLGLSSARFKVTQYGGSISVRSAVGQGTEVTVTLPAERRTRSPGLQAPPPELAVPSGRTIASRLSRPSLTSLRTPPQLGDVQSSCGCEETGRSHILYAITQAIAGTLDLDEILEKTWREISRLLRPDSCVIAPYDEDTDRFFATFGIESGKQVIGPQGMSSKDGYIGWILRTGQPLLVSDLPREEPSLAAQGIVRMRAGDLSRVGRSYLGVPMTAQGRPQGVLSIQSYQPGAFSSDDLGIMKAVADQIGAAIRNSRMLRKVEEQADLLTSVVENVPIGIAVFDTVGAIVIANAPFWSCFECDDTSAHAPIPSMFIPSRGISAELASRFRRALETGTATDNYRYVCDLSPSGRRAVLRVWCKPLLDGSGAATGGLVLARDVTEEEEMFQRSVRAERANALNEMAKNVAHNFNNLLAVIRGCADLIVLDKNDRAAVLEHARMIIETVHRTSQISRQIQSFTGGRDPVESTESVELRAVVDKALATSEQNLQKLSQKMGSVARVEVKLQPDLLVRAKGTELQDVVCSLIFNAAEAMPQGGTITISAGERTEGSGQPGLGQTQTLPRWVDLVISDAGTGMTEEVCARCFEPLFTTKGPNLGLGLGLSAAYGLVTRLGGDIFVRSAPGKGSAFTVRLPAAPVS